MEEHHQLELTIISAENLKDVRHLARMQTYATTWIDSNVKYKTGINELGGVNPVWNDKFVFLIPEHNLVQGGANLTIEIYSDSLTGIKLVGKVLIPLLDLKQNNALNNEKDLHYVNYPVKRMSGRIQGRIYISYRLKEKVKMEVVKSKGEPLQYVEKNGPSSIVKKYATSKSWRKGSPRFTTQTKHLPTPIPPPYIIASSSSLH